MGVRQVYARRKKNKLKSLYSSVSQDGVLKLCRKATLSFLNVVLRSIRFGCQTGQSVLKLHTVAKFLATGPRAEMHPARAAREAGPSLSPRRRRRRRRR